MDLRQCMDVRFCEGRNHRREAHVKAGTTAERHTCELRVLIASIVRAPPKRASGESFSPLTKDLHGCRQTRSWQSPARNFIPCPTTGDLSFLSVRSSADYYNSLHSPRWLGL